MPHTPAPDSPSLAGLAAANGPWLTERLLRLADQGELPLDRQLAQEAVDGTSRVLAGLLAREGRLALQPPQHPDRAEDPAFALGREQALQHRAAGLLLPASLKVQRLLRRAYDDLVRESWVEKDSRARAHEDVERFFERALAGLVAAWTGHAAPPPDPGLTERLALREDQLRRAMDAARQLTVALRESRQRAEALAAGLELARGQAVEAQARCEARTASLEREIAQAEAAAVALRGRVAELEAALLERGQDRQGHAAEVRALREQLELAQAEASAAQAEAAAAQAQGARQAGALRAAERLAADLRSRTQASERRLTAQEAELARLRSERAALADEAEAMRARLAETGSRLAAVRAAEGEEALARAASLEQGTERLLAEIEAATRGELGQSLAAFIRLPQELLDDPATPPAQAGMLAAIRDSGYRLVNTVNLALDLFRMERGQYRPPIGRSLDWAAALRRAAREVSQRASAAGARVELLLDGAPLPPEAALPAPGDPLLACALAERLLQEAIAAAPGAEIRAGLERSGDGAGLEVSWPGALAPEEARGHFAAPRPGDADHARRWTRRAALLLAQALGGTLGLRTGAGRVALVLRLPPAQGQGNAPGAEGRLGEK